MLVLALLALALVIYELGSYAVELRGRRGRRFRRSGRGPSGRARPCSRVTATRPGGALSGVAAQRARWPTTLAFIVEHARTDGGEHQLNKALADFDFDAQRRLGRTRMLVRAGPALGLMGTLIPLSPALTGLANGNTTDAQPGPAGRVQRDRRRAADRRCRVRALALPRSHVRPGSLRPRVPRGRAQRPASRRQSARAIDRPV